MRTLSGHAAMLVLLLLPATVAAQRHAGVMILPPAGTYTPQLSALSDAILNTISGLPDWEAVLLDADCPCVRAASASQQLAQLAAGGSDDQLLELALVVDLDDLLLVRIGVAEPAATRERVRLVTRWARTDQQMVSGFDLEMPGLTPADVKTAAEQFASRLTEASPVAVAVAPPMARTAPVTTPTPDQPPAAATFVPPPPPVETAPADTEPVATAPDATPKVSDHPGAQRLAAARAALAIGDLDLARREADLALRQGAPLYEIHLFRADLAVAENQPEEQRRWLERAATTNPQAVEPLLRLGAVFRSQGLWQKAVECYDRAIALDASCLPAYTGAAAVLTARGRPKQAAEYLAEAVARNPEDNALLMRLGDAYRQANMPAEAEEAYDLAARTAEPNLAAQILDKLGDLYVSAGQFEEGFYCYAEAGRLRGGAEQPLAQKRYEQIMATADEAVMTALQAAEQAFGAYYRERTMPRERAYLVAEQSEAQMAEVSSFAVALVPPSAVRQTHLRRQLFYNLAAEATVALMTYLDTNLEQALSQFERAAREARVEFEGLQTARVP